MIESVVFYISFTVDINMERKNRIAVNRARKIEKHKLLSKTELLDLNAEIKLQKSFLRRILEKVWFIKDDTPTYRRRKIYK